MTEEYTDFIGWKLEDISDILESDAGFEMPLDSEGWDVEPLNGNRLFQYLQDQHNLSLAWSFSVENPRSGGFSELGSILIGLEVDRMALDVEKLFHIRTFKLFLASKQSDVSDPLFFIEKHWEYPTIAGPWWKV